MKEFLVDIAESALTDMDDIYRYAIERFDDPERGREGYTMR